MELPAGTWIWAENHWTPEGATTLTDGIADVSGGMVYYIADGELPVPGMDYLYPGIPSSGEDAIPLSGQLVAFMLGSVWAGGGDHGTLCASATVAQGMITDVQGATGEKVQYAPDVQPQWPIAVGIVGNNSGTLWNFIVTDYDDYLLDGRYEFYNVGDDWEYPEISRFDMLLVNEGDNGLTEDEAEALKTFYDAGNPIIMGMDDLDEASKPVQDAVQYIFGAYNSRDGNFNFNTITDTFGVPANHPIADGLTWADTGVENDYFELDGADWVVRDDADGDGEYDEYFVTAYEGNARTVLMGEILDDWYEYTDWSDFDKMPQPLLHNAIDWVAANIADPGTDLFFDDFSAGLGDWTTSGLWHLDHMTGTLDPMTAPMVFSPTVSFNDDDTGTYSTTTAVEGSLTLADAISLPELDEGIGWIDFTFRSYEDTELMRVADPITSSTQITVGVVGDYSWLAANLGGDSRLGTYAFVNAGDNFTSTVQQYGALVVAESDAGLTVTETQVLKDFYDAGKPIVMGMDDVGMLDWAEQSVINEIFGVDKARDDDFTTTGSVSDHPIGYQVTDPGDPGGNNEYFLEDGAEWVVEDSGGRYHVLAYEGTANTVIFGDDLDDWYFTGSPGGQLVTNALIWAIEGIDEPPSSDPADYDMRYVEISTDGGSTWETLWSAGGYFSNWHQKWFDLTDYAGEDVHVRFRFDSIDEEYNDYAGWYIDNVTFMAYGIAEELPYLKAAEAGTVQGPAPGAKIIAIGDVYEGVNGMQGILDAYTFLAYGVDGEPNSGDEFVDVVSMSFGDGSVHNDGWDFESRLISYYNQNYLPNTTFLASSGNGGHGFGTINSPQGNTMVSVGASTLYGSTDVFGGGLAEDQLLDGEVTPFSGRGPDALGRPDPDVVATGAWGAGSTPVNLAYGYGAGLVPYLDGGNAWYMWGGTSRSAPEAAGVTALLYNAYYSATTTMPTFETAREILMSGADDLNHDVLMQGAGRVNADRATDVAGEHEGVYVSPSLLAAGEYEGTHYESFGNILYPGDTWDQTFTVYNTGAADATVDIGDEMLSQTHVITYSTVVSPFTGMEDPIYGSAGTYYYYANYFVGADPTTTTHGMDLAVPIPDNADFMQVQLVTPFELFDFDYDDPDPSSISYNYDQRWSLTVFDWEDRNGDGKLWEDGNGDGIVNPQAYGPPEAVDVSALGDVTETELNRFGYSYNYAAQQEVTVRLGDRTDVDNIVVGIVHRMNNNFRSMGTYTETMEFYQENPLQVKVIFYEKSDWDLVTESTASLTVPAGGDATFDATFTVPSDQAPGLYEGAITVDDGTHLSIIPTTVNVAVPSSEMLFTLGGTERAATPYDNGRMFGGWTWYSVYEEGDWRYYYYDADTGFDQQYLYVRNQWGEMCDNMPAFNETVLWNPNPGDQFSLAEPEKFGPYGLQYAGGTWDAYGPQTGWGNPREGSWWMDGDGMYQPESRVWGTLWDGLNQVQFRNILNTGDIACGEAFEATGGVFGVDAPMDGIQIDTDDLSGSFELDAVSPVDGLMAYASGFSGEKETFRNQDVPQGKHYEEWPADLMDGWVYTFGVTNTSGIEIETFGPNSSDIDLYLMYDANGDGIFTPWDNREQLASSYTFGSHEYIEYYGDFNNGNMVQDGTYAVVMYGYYVESGDQFDLHLTTYGGDSLSIAGATPDNNYVLDVTPGDPETLMVNWEVPSSGVWEGYLVFAMPWEEESQYYYMGPNFFVPVTINASGVEAEVTKTVDKESVLMGHEILTYTIEIRNEGDENVSVEVMDLLPEGVAYHEQWIDDPDEPGDGEWFVAKWWYENGAYGYFRPDDDDYLRWAGDLGPSVSGKLYIQYQVKVDKGFVGEIVNKADVTFDYGNYYHTFLSDTAMTEVLYGLFLPLISRQSP